jgi:hypothetical protein
MIELRPPAALPAEVRERKARSVFLAGSIEQGAAVDWQARFVDALGDLEVTVLNPRRDAWDASWVQRFDNPEFREQVEWELAALEAASVVAMCFDSNTKSPITLLELGLHARSGKLLVHCPDGFWRKGNVEVVCRRYGVPLFDSFSALVEETRTRLKA